MYLEMATEEDMKMVENWKADADGILIFVCLSMIHADSVQYSLIFIRDRLVYSPLLSHL